MPNFQLINLQNAVAVVNFLGYKADLKEIKSPTLEGRFQKVAKNVTIDVGHNILASKVIRDNFINKKVILVYNSFER